MNAPAAVARVVLLGLVSLVGGPPALAGPPDDSTARARPDPASVQTYGPGYRHPQAGWIVVHIEGTPYDRGYQHGRLLAPEIADYVRTLSSKRSARDPAAAWDAVRTTTNALFLRRYAPEFLEEMKGIADGAAAAGATFSGRALDLLDVAAINSDIELEFLDSALDATATGLESRRFGTPPDVRPAQSPPEHCSAFAATGPATADGKAVIGHITMFSLPFVRHFNVWLDIKPEKGHRVLMQTYPGGIQSGMDYYMNDAGLVVAETTIRQTRFEADAEPLASRIRSALQYGASIDDVVKTLRSGNNGLYTNEWLIADTKTNEIAMFELGTHKSRLWRSSQDQWIGGTKGFYWGCNNAKDLDVRLETVPSLEGKPANVVFHPSDRDMTWIRLYEKHRGKIGAEFGFEAFTTPPLAAFASLDAKFTTAEMAGRLETWARFGPPLGKTWDPTDADRERGSGVRALVSNDWTVLSAAPPPIAPPAAEALAGDGSKPPAPVPAVDRSAQIERLRAMRAQQREQVARLRAVLDRPERAPASPPERAPAASLDTYRRLSEDLTRIQVLRITAQTRLDQLYRTRGRLSQIGDDSRRKEAINDLFLSDSRVAAVTAQKAKLEKRLQELKRLTRNPQDPAITRTQSQLEELRARLADLFQQLGPSLEREVERRAAVDESRRKEAINDLFLSEARVAAITAQKAKLEKRLVELKRLVRNADADPAVVHTQTQIEELRARLDDLFQKLGPSLEREVERRAADAASIARSVTEAEAQIQALKTQEAAILGKLEALKAPKQPGEPPVLVPEFARRDLTRAEQVLDRIEDSLIEALGDAVREGGADRTGDAPRSGRAVDLLGALGPKPAVADDPNAPVPPAWHGTLLPKSDVDTWLAAAFADYEPIVARELARIERARLQGRAPSRAELEERALGLFDAYSRYKTAVARLGHDVPLSQTHAELISDLWYQRASGKGVLLLAALRERMGNQAFLALMDGFGRGHAGQAVTAGEFREAATAAAADLNLAAFFDAWLDQTGLPSGPSGGFWSIDSFEADLERTVIVVGTLRESDAQREAGERLQRQIQRKWSNVAVPILTDREATEPALAGRHLLLVGRPETNRVTARFANRLPIAFGPASFVVDGETYAHSGSAVIAAGPRADDPTSSLVVFAGLSADATWRCVEAVGGRHARAAEVLVLPEGGAPRRLVVEPKPEPTAAP